LVDLLYRIATWLLPLMLSLVLSDLVPALVANLLGDGTAKERGRLSLNPLVHVDPLGTVLIPLALIAAGGPVIGWTRKEPTPRPFESKRPIRAFRGSRMARVSLSQAKEYGSRYSPGPIPLRPKSRRNRPVPSKTLTCWSR
jgi:Zn-dependent protease